MMHVVEMAASLSVSLLEEKCVHMVAWYEEKNQKIVKKRISKEEHVYELMNRMLFLESYSDKEAAGICYKEAWKGENFSSIVRLDMQGNIWVNEEKKVSGELAGKNVDWEKIYLTV